MWKTITVSNTNYCNQFVPLSKSVPSQQEEDLGVAQPQKWRMGFKTSNQCLSK